MKKLILVLSLIAIAFTSCSKDDDNESSQDLLIGTWTYSSAFEDGVEIPLTDCEKQETEVFNANGTFTVTTYDDFDGPCVEDGTISGTWVNSGNGNYTITVFGFPFEVKITFEGNTHSFEYSEDGVDYIDVYVKK
jgi:hypothetical protein